jgi:uncharacterized protein YggT (Ycf19 family)
MKAGPGDGPRFSFGGSAAIRRTPGGHVTGMNDFWAYWYFHIPNFVLAAIMYTLLGRMVLGLFVPEDWDNYIWRFFRLITDPFVRFVRSITPSVLAHPVVMIFGVLWLMALRVAYFMLLVGLGLAPISAQGG